ncbi:hypothetical protein SSP35_01_02700 [Streptomyces sp. NBRC 110611]|uniref:hypothetical protein n=1 Tax=Streptomyces sp. NBRC 110611 TaxID=1621259 RepID=UPI0008561DFA|nr:hypothetical protein [Streptomyces sp. NBRC 110611]GAU64933.1 hypothetical protein SSP35_01_02700 [Streptomyces sp. NBRC 110611]
MPAVFVLPAAVRLPRTVTARRALLAGLFLVGFVALGFAFGPGAHADDRTGSTPALTGAASPGGEAVSTPGRETAAAALRDEPADTDQATTRAKSAEGVQSGSAALSEAVRRPVAEQAGPVTGALTRSVGRVVRKIGVVGEIADTAGAVLPSVELPSVKLPSVGLPSGAHTGRPGDDRRHQPGRTPGDVQSAGPRTAATASGGGVAAAAQPEQCAGGPRQASATEHTGRAAVEQPHPGHGDLPGQLPQGPVAPASHTAGDGHGPRDGDQHAAAPAHLTPFRLLPGGVRTADGAPTRRRAEEILEFPG